jgi:pimeloyl-ACP methyl ester carboxylesterase
VTSRSPVRTAGAVALGAGIATVAVAAAVSVAGRRVRRAEDPEVDPVLRAPGDVIHHQLRTADGGSLHVVERGAGRPVVLLHGVTLQWWVWGAQFHTLADRYRVVAWDMRGHGRSRAGHDGVSLEATADDLVTLLEGLDLHDALVVGHSMGGMALGRFCARHPDVMVERCAGLMFLATSVAPIALPLLAGGAAGLAGLVGRGAGVGVRWPRLRPTWSDNAASALFVRGAFGRRASGTAVDDVRRMLAEVDPSTTVEAATAIATHDVREDLRHVALPTLVVVGDADLLTPPAHARAVVAAVPGAQLRVLSGVGHQVMQEDPEALGHLVDDLADLADNA